MRGGNIGSRKNLRFMQRSLLLTKGTDKGNEGEFAKRGECWKEEENKAMLSKRA